MNPTEFSLLSWLAARMQEASTYAGMASMILGSLHVANSPDMVNAALGVVVAMGGLVSIVLKEGVSK